MSELAIARAHEPLDPVDRDRVLAIVTAAFDADPLWRWAMPDADGGAQHRHRFWSIVLDGALRYPWTSVDSTSSAVAVWIPPGEPERDPSGDRALERLLKALPSRSATRVRGVLAALERHHPVADDRGRAPAYLSLLAVLPERQGRGLGGSLLTRTLAAIDAAGWPAYLESSAERNVGLYRRHGFVVRERIRSPRAPVITTMLRAGQVGDAPAASGCPALPRIEAT